MDELPTLPTLYSEPDSLEGHRLRFLALDRNKDMQLAAPEHLPHPVAMSIDLNLLPCLIEKNVIVLGHNPLETYLIERYPGNSLLPTTDPASRAKMRMICETTRSWYNLPDAEAVKKIDQLVEALSASSIWFAGGTFSLLDIALAPFLWRNRAYCAKHKNRSLVCYKERLFARPAFKASLPIVASFT